MKFCPDCGVVLFSDTLTGSLVFICPRCKETYPSEPVDTLIFSQNFRKDDSLKFQTFIKSAGDDNTNYIVEHDCAKCKGKYAKMIRVGAKMTPTYICTSC